MKRWLYFTFNFPVKHSGSVTFDEIVAVARVMRPRSIARELSGKTRNIRQCVFFYRSASRHYACLSEWLSIIQWRLRSTQL